MIRGVVNRFNRGEIDQRALAREDIKRVNNSASSMVNFMPSRLGNMMYRGGSEYIATLNNTYDHKLVPFIAATDDTALIDFYNDKVEFIVNDVPVTVSAVTSAFTNTDFTTNITGWTDNSGGSSTTAWFDYGTGDGALALDGDGSSNAVSYYTIGTTQSGVEHFLRVVVDYAPVVIKIGTGGVSTYDIYTGTLKPGTHVLNFTPASNITVTFENSTKYRALINSVDFDSGTSNLVINTPMTSAELKSLSNVKSADVVFCAFESGKHFQIEHRGDKSWSVVDFRADDGPFEVINTGIITMTVAHLAGDSTLTASSAYFNANHVGSLFKATSASQTVTATVAVDTGAGTDDIRVTGVSSTRAFTVLVTGFATGTVTLQRSSNDNGPWDDVESYTTNQNKSFNDTFDNSIFHYRLYVKAGDNAGADTLQLKLTYGSGSIDGICRVTKYTSTTVAQIQILTEFGALDATLDWYEGSWSTDNGFPSSVELSEGRLWFGGKESIWGSVSDSYFSFDRSIEGNSASILRTIGYGPTDPIKWIKSANQLIFSTVGDELVLRSTSFGELLTQSTANVKTGSTQGSSDVEPVKIDSTIYFVQRSGIKIYSLDNDPGSITFSTIDVNLLNQTICAEGIHRMAVARQPETRIYVVLDDGTMAIYSVDAAEDVTAWSRLEMASNIKDVAVLPSADEDAVYVVVKRTLGTYLEKFAKFKNSIGGSSSETFDSFVRYTSPSATITGLSHLEGETVGIWGDGQDRGTFTVSSGGFTAPAAYTNVIVGLPYTADYVSNKLSGYDNQTVLTEKKRICDTGLVLMNYWPGSLTVGSSVALLKPMPDIEDGKQTSTTVTQSDYSEQPFEYDGETEVDPRIYMRATGPVTILAMTFSIDGEYGDKED